MAIYSLTCRSRFSLTIIKSSRTMTENSKSTDKMMLANALKRPCRVMR